MRRSDAIQQSAERAAVSRAMQYVMCYATVLTGATGARAATRMYILLLRPRYGRRARGGGRGEYSALSRRRARSSYVALPRVCRLLFRAPCAQRAQQMPAHAQEASAAR